MDTLSTSERSERMSRIPSNNTKPDLAVRSIAHRLGCRFRLHRKYLAGSLDLEFPVLKKAIFLHGCFWHARENCKVANWPKSRRSYWDEKFRRNKKRDASSEVSLKKASWKVATIWECDVKSPELVAEKIIRFLGRKPDQAGKHG